MFSRVLVANRGEIALRVVRALREMGIESVVAYSQADKDTRAVQEADIAVCIGPAPSAKSYLNFAAVIGAAVSRACQAVHPGYGFLSENSDFARACADNDLVFIGPSADVIDRMGEKSNAKQTMIAAGVPCVPGSAGEVETLEDAFKAIKLRSEAMAKAAENSTGAMAAIIGADNETIDKICGEVNGFLAPANYNSPVQTVIAGEQAAVDEAIAKFTEMGKRSVKLAVSAAFHTKMMQSAADEFKAAIKDFTFSAPKCDFYANLYGKKLEDFSDMRSYLAAHICSPVKFVDELNAMQSAGIDTFIELGPNKVLTGLVRKTLKGVVFANIENLETLEKALAAVKGE